MDNLAERTIIGSEFLPKSSVEVTAETKTSDSADSNFSILDQQKAEDVEKRYKLGLVFLQGLVLEARRVDGGESSEKAKGLQVFLKAIQRGLDYSTTQEGIVKLVEENFLTPDEAGRLLEYLHPDPDSIFEDVPEEDVSGEVSQDPEVAPTVETSEKPETVEATEIPEMPELVKAIKTIANLNPDRKTRLGMLIMDIEDQTDIQLVQKKISENTYLSAEEKAQLFSVINRKRKEIESEDKESVPTPAPTAEAIRDNETVYDSIATYMLGLAEKARIRKDWTRVRELSLLHGTIERASDIASIHTYLDHAYQDGLLTEENVAYIENLLDVHATELEKHFADIAVTDVPTPTAVSTQEVPPVPTPTEVDNVLVPLVEPIPTPDVQQPTDEEVYRAYIEALPSEEIIRENLNIARGEFAAKESAYKNAVREKKGKIKTFFDDLGRRGKQLPEMDKSPEWVSAQQKYIAARRQLRVFLQEKKRTEEEQSLASELSIEVEKESASLQRKVLENLPPQERSRLMKFAAKVYEGWTRLPPAARIGTSAALMTLATASTGGLGLAAAVGNFGYRVLRSGTSVATAGAVGKMVDIRFKNKAEKKKQDILQKYTTAAAKESSDDEEAGPDERSKIVNFAEIDAKERQAMADFEDARNQSKRDRLKKAAAMLVAGAGVGAVFTEVANLAAATEVLPTGTGSHSEVGTKVSGPGHAGTPPAQVRPTPFNEPAARPAVASQTPPAPEPAHEVVSPLKTPVEVEVSSKGYIDTFAKLKTHIAEQYPDAAKAPTEVKDMLSMSPEKLAMKFGFYKPGQEMDSAFGAQGEHLLIDKNGNLVFEGLKGNKQILFDAKTNTTHMYEGRMFNDHFAETEARMDMKLAEYQDMDTHPNIGPDSHFADLGDQPYLTTPVEPSMPSPFTHPALDDIKLGSGLRVQGGYEIPHDIGEVSTAGISGNILDTMHNASPLAGAAISTFDEIGSTQRASKSPEHIGQSYDVPGGAINLVEQDSNQKLTKVMFNDKEIAKPSADFRSPVDVAAGKLPLDDAFQFGSEYANIRKAYNLMFERMVMDWPKGTVDLMMRTEYDGGRLLIIQKGNALSVLLNGRKIAEGEVKPDGTGAISTQTFANEKGRAKNIELNRLYTKAHLAAISELENSNMHFKYNATI